MYVYTYNFRQRCRWEDGFKMGIRETDWEGVEWIHLAQDTGQWRTVINKVMNLQVLAPRSWLVV
jgi:hypothetical protein